MSTLRLDLETYSPVDLKTAGTYRYAEQAEILLFAYALDDGPVEVWDCTEHPLPDKALTVYLEMKGVTLCAHNSSFDRVILKLNRRLNTPCCFIDETVPWRDTEIRALAHGLPGGLLRLSEIFKLPIDKAKDKEGHKLIHLFCKPQKKRDGTTYRATRHTHPAEWKKFVEYAALDVEAMRELDKKLPTWNDTEAERALWYMDQRINDRGFLIDTDLAQKAIDAVEGEKIKLNARTKEATDGAVHAATQRDALLKHILEEHGVLLPDMTEDTLTRRLEDPNLPEAVKELISLRLQSAGNSNKKYQTLLNSASSDGRLRGTLQFCGAPRTGRWSGRKFQPQNLPRQMLSKDEIAFGVDCLKSDCAELIYDSVADIASQCIRGLIIAPPGKKLVVSDLSSIEGRMLAWLAGEEWKLQAYREFDRGIGHDMYTLTYSKTFQKDPDEVSKDERQLGKVLELALGYGGGVGAFISMAAVYGVDLEAMANSLDGKLEFWAICEARAFWEATKLRHGLSERVFIACDAVKRQWRYANALIESFWYTLENDVRNCLQHGYATERKSYTVDKKGSWLRIKLPSGRFLCYAGAKIDDEGKITYLGMNQYSRKWGRLSTYGGKLAENLTQAASRDVFAHGVLLAEEEGYAPLLLVHDEDVTETPDTLQFSSDRLSEILSIVPSWAPGLPLAAAGFEAKRYRKG